jgi:polyhydroxybutyrate depolymerase
VGVRGAFGVLARRLAAKLGVACAAGTREAWFIETGSQRPYRVIARRAHDVKREAPVLFALHAYATASDLLLNAYSLALYAAKDRGFLLVVPEGTIDRDQKQFWNASAACCGNVSVLPDDLAYLRGVLSDVKRRYAVDPRRVYALGVSNGGFMAHRWACSANDLRAFASVSGMGPGPGDPACAPPAPVDVLQSHGDADAVIRYEGGSGVRGDYPSARASLEPWLKINRCGSSVDERRWSLAHGWMRRSTWKGADGRVALWTLEGRPHHLRSVQFAIEQILDFLDKR